MAALFPLSDELDAGSIRLLDALSYRSPRTAGDIAARSGLSVTEVGSLLGQLEFSGRVEERERGWLKSRPAG
jgi:DNA processing protein